MIGSGGLQSLIKRILLISGVGTLLLLVLFQDAFFSLPTIREGVSYRPYIGGLQQSRTNAYSTSDSTPFSTVSTSQPSGLVRNNFEKKYDFSEIHEERKLTIYKACDKSKDGFQGDPKSHEVERNSLIDQRHRIVYCRVQKVGSTFITSLLHMLNVAPYNKNDRQKGLQALHRIQHIGFVNLHSSLFKSFKFMFTRDPYSRLLSGYVDKLFTANTVYWQYTGTYIKNKILKRQGPNTQCGHDVTFPQFIKYVIQSEANGKHTDRHFTPIYIHCRPCQIPYDFIGKMETFKSDSMILINAWNKNYGVNISYGDFEQDTVLTRVKSHIGRLYKMRKQIVKCTSFYSVMKRVWKDFQIRGFLSKHVPFVFTEKKANSVTESQFVSVLENILKDKSTDHDAIRQQKTEALIQAYSLVPMEDLIRLRHVVRPDCQLFGYNDSPPNIFNRTADAFNSVHYQYFDVGE
ncbi:Carbohydrate sulfotransferase 14 [Mizuhopecten yessoensis]|uniref:Carbohydrate sulfotransferase n=1 Tax=Mizuhopecten yessoensis TaxID=6573 RepID=A0A210QAU0_MIZYE|nr:Carbohydrate sulfotransferase 14 [Mizuhopecten yessoensis]